MQQQRRRCHGEEVWERGSDVSETRFDGEALVGR